MSTVDLNDHKEAGSCGEIATQLIKTGRHSNQAIRYYIKTNKVFIEDLTEAKGKLIGQSDVVNYLGSLQQVDLFSQGQFTQMNNAFLS